MDAPKVVLALCTTAAALIGLGYLPAQGAWLLIAVGVLHSAALAPLPPLSDTLALGAAAPVGSGGTPSTTEMEPQVFDLLAFLVRNCDRVVSKDDLLAAVWGGRIVSESALATRINAVRRIIGDSGEQHGGIRFLVRNSLAGNNARLGHCGQPWAVTR